MKIGNAAANATTTINLQFLPQYLTFDDATTISALKVTVLGDGTILDVNQKGILALRKYRLLGQASAARSMIPLANGIILNKTVQIVIVNAANASDVYATSIQKGSMYLQTIGNAVLLNSGYKFEKFAALAIPDLAAADEVNVEFIDGLVQKLELNEIDLLSFFSENQINVAFDNFAKNIKSVQITPAATQTVFLSRWISIGNVNQNVM